RKRGSPSCTSWLSRTSSSTMCPLTCGAIPTKLARTVASSVCGRVSHWRSVTATARTAAAMIAAPSTRPTRRRTPGCEGVAWSVMTSDPEERKPEHEGDEDSQTRVHQPPRAHVGIDSDTDQEGSRQEGHDDPDDRAQHPGREEG